MNPDSVSAHVPDIADGVRNRKMVTCKTCGRRCSNLKIHYANEHKIMENSHICKKCPQSFRTKLDLQSHENIQHVIKHLIRESKCNSFICCFCHRIYKYKINLINHLQTHLKKDNNSQVTDK